MLANDKRRSHTIVVRWNDAPIGHFLANYDSSLSFEYTIDINPAPANELGLKSVLYKKEKDQDQEAEMRNHKFRGSKIEKGRVVDHLGGFWI